MHSLIKILLCFLWLTCFNVCYMYDLQRQSQRLDDLEIELLNEGKHRRADIFELREKVEKLESFLKSNSVGEYTPGTTGQENKSENDLTPLGSKFLRECPSMYQSLLTGFKVEKALNVRARRHMTEIDAALTSLQQNTRTAVTDNMEILKVGITRVENTSSEILTNTRQLASHTEKLPQLTDGVEKVKTLLDNYIQNVSRPRSCSELLQRGHTSSGLYKVYPGTWTEGIQVCSLLKISI